MSGNPGRHSVTQSRHREWLIVLLVSLGSALGIMAMSSTTLIIAAIMREFGTTLGTAAWVLIGYIVVMAGTLMVVGRFADHHGFKRTFLEGTAIFTAASLICAIAPGLPILIGARALQAVGASMVVISGPVLVAAHVPGAPRHRSLAYHTVVSGTGGAIGVGIGGLLINLGGWRWLFILNIPIGIFILVAGWILLTECRGGRPESSFDYRGSVLFSCTLIFVLVALSLDFMPEAAYQAWFWVPLAAAAGCAAAFIFYLSRTADPVPDLSLLFSRHFSSALAASFFVFALSSGIGFFFPFVMVVGFKAGPAIVGLVLMASLLGAMLTPALTNRLSDRFGNRPVCIGASLIIGATLILALIAPGMAAGIFAAEFVLFRIAQGCFAVPATKLALSNVPKEKQNQGLGLLLTSRYVAYAIGIAVVFLAFEAGCFAAGLPNDGTALLSRMTVPIELAGYRMTMLVCVVIAALAIITSLFLKDGGNRPADPDDAGPTGQDLVLR